MSYISETANRSVLLKRTLALQSNVGLSNPQRDSQVEWLRFPNMTDKTSKHGMLIRLRGYAC